MGVHSVQISVGTVTAVPLMVPGPGSGGADTSFKNTQGAVGDPLPVMVTNLAAATDVVYVGGATVTTSTGTPIQPLASLPFNFVGTDAQHLWAIASGGATSVAVIALRQ
jgi:hypothetical protein